MGLYRPDGTLLDYTSGANYAVLTGRAPVTGTYYVLVHDDNYDATGNYSITLTLLPRIVAQPVSQTVTQGTTVTFSVAVTGASSFTYLWQKSGVNINGATNATLTLT